MYSYGGPWNLACVESVRKTSGGRAVWVVTTISVHLGAMYKLFWVDSVCNQSDPQVLATLKFNSHNIGKLCKPSAVFCDPPGPVFSCKLRYLVGFGSVEIVNSTNPKPTIYRNLFENWALGRYF